MIVIHVVWENVDAGKLHLWVETSHPVATAPKGTSAKRSTKVQQPQSHPFALDHQLLQRALQEWLTTSALKNAAAGTLALRLPSTAHRPQPSPELILEQANDTAKPTEFKTWQIDTLSLDAQSAFELLRALPDETPHGVAFGSDLRFWATAAMFAFELITKECYIPALQEAQQNGKAVYQATWQASLVGEDDERMHNLAALMPPVCWSFLPPDKRLSTVPHHLLRHFLDHSIDAFVRQCLVDTPLLSKNKLRQPAYLSLAEQWLHGLKAHDVTLKATEQQLRDFASAMYGWLDQLRPAAATAPFRTCFRLDQPDPESDQPMLWRVSYYLQANDDRSLLVPADKVWQERSSTLTFLKRQFENPQERLLSDLGKATRVFPAIENSLRTARPKELDLTTEQAYAFLRESVPLLEQSGYGVLIPTWWQKPSARVRVKLKVKPKEGSKTSRGLLGLDSIVAYDWVVSVGDSALSDTEFESLVSLKMPLVRVRGQWVELRPEEIEAAIAFFEKKRLSGDMTLGDALRLGLGEEQSEVGLAVAGIETEGWIKDLMDRLSNTAKIATIKQPSQLHGQLRPYQLKGASWMAFLKQFGFGACLADDMGLGKTVTFISLLLHDREQGEAITAPSLLICPMSIVGNWQRELQRFAPSLSVMIHHGAERLSDEAFLEEARQHDIVITTYSLALRDQEHLARIDWNYLVIDEAQNIKNDAAKQTKAIKGIKARYRVALTGTPVENRLSELWSIMDFLNPRYLGSGTEFRRSFATPIEKYHDAKQAETLKQLIQPFVLRRVKTDKSIIKDLPDKLEMKVFCNLTQEQASLYEAVVKEMMEKIEGSEGIERKGLVLSTLLKLKQVCNHPAQFMSDGSNLSGRSGKLARLEEMLAEALAAGDKALIFTQFAEMGKLLRQYLQSTLDSEVLFLHGATSKKQRDIMVQRFQEERHGPSIFLLSIKAGGVGLNLTAANHVFHFDRWWNPAVENQATDRAFRIGQLKNVQVHKFVCIGTVEEHIDQMIEEKKGLAESIVGSGENWLTEMSTDQLKDLFALSRESVGE
ncbi:MAG TPA: DEAD/DEAH box helicase [Ktedonobacteraceae bacterium]|nr:DEAD/DEAH box helicase [Ktedonobacteraceae bacterium]